MDITSDDLLVKRIRVRVFKWQVAAEHGKENDTTAPDVNEIAAVLKPLNHLRRGIARTSASRFEEFVRFVGVGEAEVNNFNILVGVEQKVFRL